MAEEEVDLNKLNECQRQVFKEKVFTGKDTNGVTFNEISFLSCKFDGGTITNCKFDKCEFNSCDFNNTKIQNCEYDDSTYIGECNFDGTEFMDVTIKGNLVKNNFAPTCKVKNLIIGGKQINDIAQITSVVETVSESVDDDWETDELESRASLEDDLKIYKVIFPQLMKQYPAIEKDADSDPEYPGYHAFVGNIEFAFAQDEGGWRVMFFVKGTDDCLGSNLVYVPTNQEITFDTCKEAFEDEVKAVANGAASRSNAEVIKKDLNEFIKLVFNTTFENVETICSFVVDGSDKVEDVRGTFNSGYDMVNKKNCIIVGKPFTSSNIAEANQMREQVKKYGFVIKEDIDGKSAEEIEAYTKENPYSCFVLEQDVVKKVSIKPFKKNSIVVIK